VATRCRPLILQGEPVHFDKVFGALNAFLQPDEEARKSAERLRAGWRRALNPESPILVSVAGPGQPMSDPVPYHLIADAWLYGDLVHADKVKRARFEGFSLNQRYIAAVLVYGQVAVHAIALLNLIERLQGDGRLGLDPAVFTDPMAAMAPMRFPLKGFAHAPVGTPLDVLGAALDGAYENAPVDESTDGA